MGRWNNGIVEEWEDEKRRWNDGTIERWYDGTIERWDDRTMER